MSKVYVQSTPVVLLSTTALAINGTVSGSLHCGGYTKLIGLAISNASSTASGIRIQQSSDYGASWDYESIYTIGACTASPFSIDLYGNAVKVSASNGGTTASLLRMYFALRPI